MKLNFRQGIVSHQTGAFLQVNGSGHVDLLATNKSVLFNIAHRNTNYLHSEDNTVVDAWTGPFDSGTDYWLYLDFDLNTFARTFGTTTLEPVEQSPTPGAGDAALTAVVTGIGGVGSFEVAGYYNLNVGRTFVVSGSTGNDGTYTTQSISYNGTTGKTTIVVDETIADGTVDGSLTLDVDASSNPLATDGRHWYNTGTHIHYERVSGVWTEVLRVFVAKLTGGTTFVSQSIDAPLFTNTQIGDTTSPFVGSVLFDESFNTVVRTDGTFITTDDLLFTNQAKATGIRLEANTQRAKCGGTSLAEFSVVTYSGDGIITAGEYTDTESSVLGILMESLSLNEVGAVLLQGVVINPAWNWLATGNVGDTLWVENGGLTATDPNISDPITYPVKRVPVARVVSSDTIIFEQGLGGVGPRGLTGSIDELPIATDSTPGAVTLVTASSEPTLGLVVSDTDSRLTDARTPTTHVHSADNVTFAPAGNITATDVQAAFVELDSEKLDLTGGTLTGTLTLDADPSANLEAATKQYVDATIAGGTSYIGGYDAATNTPDLDVSPSGVQKGHTYTVTAAGSFFTVIVETGDVIIAKIDDASVEADWTVVNKNIDAATETVPGIIELATQAEVDAGTDAVRAVTPLTLENKPPAPIIGFSTVVNPVEGYDVASVTNDTVSLTSSLGNTWNWLAQNDTEVYAFGGYNGSNGWTYYKATLSTPGILSSAGAWSAVEYSGLNSSLYGGYGAWINDARTKLMSIGADAVHEFDMSPAGDISGVTYNSSSPTLPVFNGGGAMLSPDRTYMYGLTGINPSNTRSFINQASVGDDSDVSTISHTATFNYNSIMPYASGEIIGINVNSDGTKLFLVSIESGTSYIREHTMSPAHDITSLTYINKTEIALINSGSVSSKAQVLWNADGTKLYVNDYDLSNSILRQYSSTASDGGTSAIVEHDATEKLRSVGDGISVTGNVKATGEFIGDLTNVIDLNITAGTTEAGAGTGGNIIVTPGEGSPSGQLIIHAPENTIGEGAITLQRDTDVGHTTGNGITIQASSSLVTDVTLTLPIDDGEPNYVLHTDGAGVLSWDLAVQPEVWASQTSATDNQWQDVAYGAGLFVAISDSGTNNRVMTSPDGITWTSRTSAADNNWQAITYGNGLFVAVASSGTNNRVMTSPDGITWTIRTSASDINWQDVTYGNGLFVAVAQQSTTSNIMTSPDGTTWTIRTSSHANGAQCVAYGNGTYVAIAGNSGGAIRATRSTDGITWSDVTVSATKIWESVVYDNGQFVAVSSWSPGLEAAVMTSPDGITWTTRTIPDDTLTWRSVTAGAGGLLVAVATSGTTNRVMTSPDGITWTLDASATDNNWQGVTYGSGTFVAVSTSGTGDRVMTLPAESASEASPGIIELATQVEVDAGVDTYRAVTPYTLANTTLELPFTAIGDGEGSIVIGTNADGNEAYNIAIGLNALTGQTPAGATNSHVIAIGTNATAHNASCIAIGTNSFGGHATFTTSTDTISLGNGANVPDAYSIAIGYYAFAGNSSNSLGTEAIAIGRQARAEGANNIAIGHLAVAGVAGSTVYSCLSIGNSSNARAGGVALGNGSFANSLGTALGDAASAQGNCVAVGRLADANQASSIAIGESAYTGSTNSIAIGLNSVAGQDGTVEINTIAIGNNAVAYETSGIAIGNGSWAGINGGTDNPSGISIGELSRSQGVRSVALGASATAWDDAGVAIGDNADAKEITTIAIGKNSIAGQTNGSSVEIDAIAIGNSALAHETSGVAIGTGAVSGVDGTSTDPDAIAIGRAALANEEAAISIGPDSDATGTSAVALGDTAQATADDAIAIGTATASGANGVAIGNAVNNTVTNTVEIGTSNTNKMVMDANGNFTVPGAFYTAKQSTTLGAAATTFAVTSNFIVLTGDVGTNTLATITGGQDGQVIRILFVDANITITDDNAHTADSIDLSAAFTSADDTVLTLIYDGTSWYECARSVN